MPLIYIYKNRRRGENMYKKHVSLFILFFILFFAFVTPVYAEETSELDIYVANEEEAIELNKYTRSKLPSSYDGYCGQYAHDIAVTVGILSPRSASYNGKDWYKGYTKGTHRNILKEGWEYECFSGESCIDDLLEKYNGRVYNFIMSMENSGPYGHAVFINAIVDDMVYFSDSYNSKFARNKKLAVVPLEEFKKYFIGGNSFENTGLIHFYETDFYTPMLIIDEEDGNERIAYIETSVVLEEQGNTSMRPISFYDALLANRISNIGILNVNRDNLYNYKYFSNGSSTTISETKFS